MDGTRLTRSETMRAVTVAIAGTACRISCRHQKPIVWATQAHPAFLADRRPDVELAIVYRSRQRGLRWIAPHTVRDRPETIRRDDVSIARTEYYRARISWLRRRIDVSIAPGFPIDGLMRTLWSLLLAPRGGLLIRAVRVVTGSAAHLFLGLSGDAGGLVAARPRNRDVFDGFVAVVPDRRGYTTFVTPFHDGLDIDVPIPAAPLEAIHVVAKDDASGLTPSFRLGRASAVAELSRWLWRDDNRLAEIETSIGSLIRLATSVPCHGTRGVADVEALERALSRA